MPEVTRPILEAAAVRVESPLLKEVGVVVQVFKVTSEERS